MTNLCDSLTLERRVDLPSGGGAMDVRRAVSDRTSLSIGLYDPAAGGRQAGYLHADVRMWDGGPVPFEIRPLARHTTALFLDAPQALGSAHLADVERRVRGAVEFLIQDVVVHAGYRRRGLGSLLLGELLGFAEGMWSPAFGKPGALRFHGELVPGEGMSVSDLQGFYEKNGFLQLGRLEKLVHRPLGPEDRRLGFFFRGG